MSEEEVVEVVPEAPVEEVAESPEVATEPVIGEVEVS